MSRVATKGIDYTNRDYEAYRTSLIQDLQKKMPEYTDTSQTDVGIVILECLANGLDVCSMYADVIANDVLLPTTQDRRIAVILARQLGYVAKNPTASIFDQVFVLSEALDRDIIIPKGTLIHTPETPDSEAIYFETLSDHVIPKGKLGNELKEDQQTYKYTVKVQQGTSILEDILGSSNGDPYQSFKLNYTEVITNSIQLMVNEGDGFVEWTQVDSFIDSEQDSLHYTVTIDEFDNCYIEFGSGTRGRVPNAYDNGIIASYRIGGGTLGNVQPNTITELSESIAFVESTFNPSTPISLGTDKETLEEIRENAPASFRTQDRAITEKDYADLIRINFYEVLKSIGIADTSEILKMNLYYYMREGYTMTSELKAQIEEFFSSRIIPGTTLELLENEKYVVDITANLIVNDDYSQQDLKSYVEDYIKNTFFAYDSFGFQDSFTKTELEQQIMKTFSGIDSFRIKSPDEDIIQATKDSQIIKLGTLTLNVTGGIVEEE